MVFPWFNLNFWLVFIATFDVQRVSSVTRASHELIQCSQ